ncbi:MAG: DNA polymerase domain-containing protein [bacterium]
MNELSYNDFKQYMDSGSITPYNVYNLDIEYHQLYSVDNYIKNEWDTIEKEQPLNILFADIELFTKNSKEFPDPVSAKYPINAITIYSSFDKTYYAYILLYNENITKFPVDDLMKLEQEYHKILLKDKYILEDDKIKIQVFGYEIDLIKAIWKKIHEIDPIILTGWNSDNFDYPYIYFRLINLLDKNETEVNNIMSKFGGVKVNKMGQSTLIKIADYPIADLMYLYKPRDEFGLNMGKKQASYTLDWVSDDELGLKKLEYKDEGMTLDQLFIEDPVNFLLYNIMDVCLTVGLNKKLKHIENYNMYRRLMRTSFDASLRGSSILFDTFVLYELKNNNKYVRFGINDETNISISDQDIKNLPKPTGKKNIKWSVKNIESKIIKNVTNTYPGAYVKNSPGKLFTANDGLLLILDATSLYPSMIRQSNISFDSFFGRIIDPNVYKLIDAVKTNLGDLSKVNQFCGSILELSIDHVENKKPANKNDAYQYNYYITSHVFTKLIKDCKNFENLLQPKSYQDYIMLKNYFLTLIDMMERIHKEAQEYNSFCYDMFINGGERFTSGELYILENFNEPTLRINKVNVNNFHDYLKQNNLIVTLSGALFKKHDTKLGLFSDWLELMANRRNQYKKDRDSNEYESEKYKFFDMLQKATKIAMNTSYGLYGLTTFRYSNSHLAKAITTEGRLMLKICQQISEMVIDNEK